MPTALPHGIDWGKLELRFQSNKLSAYWGEHCIASVHADSPQDRPHLITRLKEEVRRRKHNYARRPAGARASRNLDEMFAGFAAAMGQLEEEQRRAEDQRYEAVQREHDFHDA